MLCVLYRAIIPVFVLVKDIGAAFMNIRAHQISLHGFKMPKSYLSKVILPERGEVDLIFFFFICRDIYVMLPRHLQVFCWLHALSK